MSGIFSTEEREELNSLKQDLLGPIRSFVREVGDDTVGDAKRFYSARARRAKQSAAHARDKAAEQIAQLRQEQERARKQRKVMAKRTFLVLALLAVFSLVVLSAALSAHADQADPIALGESFLRKIPP